MNPFKVGLVFIALLVAGVAAAQFSQENGRRHAYVPQRVCIEGHTDMVKKWVPKVSAPGPGPTAGFLKQAKRKEFICTRDGDYRIQDLRFTHDD